MASGTSLAERPGYGYYRVVLKVSLGGEDPDGDFHVIYDTIHHQTFRGEWTSDDFWLDDLRGSYGRGGIRSHHQALYFFADLDETRGPTEAVFVLENAPAGPYDRPRAGRGTVRNPRNPCWAGAPLSWERVADPPGDDG